jgi:hypothetical protein
MAYKPSQRSLHGSVLSSGGWMTGTFHVAEKSSFIDWLNLDVEFVRLTNVRMPGRFDSLEFLAVQRAAIMVVVPDEADPPLGPVVKRTVWHRVAFLLEMGIVEGSLELLEHIRISDYFVHEDGFVTLRDCILRLSQPGTLAQEQKATRVLVNAARVIGVSDLGPVDAPVDTLPAPAKTPAKKK